MKMNSLVEFTELLKNRLSDILFQEAGNDKYIYLYLADGYWTAFEKSAYRLCRIYGSSMLLSHEAYIRSFSFCDGKHHARQPTYCFKRADLSNAFKERENLFGWKRRKHSRLSKMARQSDFCIAESA